MQSAPDVESKIQGVRIRGDKNALNDWIWDETKGIVQSGPFGGMQLVKKHVWDDGNLGNKCLGCYEQELHDPIEREIARLEKLDNPQIVNIGCAEGYYAVGVARRLPKATVFIVDIDAGSVALAMQAAALNNVVLWDDNIDRAMQAPDLVLSDCEGAEVDYLNFERYPALRKAALVVESHDFETQNSTDILCDRFNDSHNVSWVLSEMMRAPNNYDCLLKLPSHAKWMAVSEGRPATQYFLYMTPKSS